MTMIIYDIHTAICPRCDTACTGTSGDSRGNLPSFNFDYSRQVFTCESCGNDCIAYYEEWNDQEDPDDNNVTNVTAELLPEQHELNQRLEKEFNYEY